MRLAGRTAVVTGAAHGIGRATALRFAAEGAELVLMDLDEEAAAGTVRAAQALGAKVHFIAVDCTDEAAVAAGFSALLRVAPPIDVLVNNVGQSARERAVEFTNSEPETWRFVLNVSLMSTLLCSRQVVPAMRHRRSGKIVNLSSISALWGDIAMADYAAAKMAVIGFTRALARELAPHQVNVNAVAPGVIRTRVVERMPADFIGRVEALIPQRRLGRPEEIAGTIAFLASDDAAYITGQTLVVDGGRYMV